APDHARSCGPFHRRRKRVKGEKSGSHLLASFDSHILRFTSQVRPNRLRVGMDSQCGLSRKWKFSILTSLHRFSAAVRICFVLFSEALVWPGFRLSIFWQNLERPGNVAGNRHHGCNTSSACYRTTQLQMAYSALWSCGVISTGCLRCCGTFQNTM